MIFNKKSLHNINKYFIFASDERSFLELKNIVGEIKKRNLPYFFLFNDKPQKVNEVHLNIQKYNFDTNVPDTGIKYPCKTLGMDLPFKPDVLLLTCESWEPEKSIMWDLKQWGTFIGCIENSTWTHNNIKTKLEIASRRKWPTNYIDVFFDHGKWGLETKKQAGWWAQKSIITGNPKFDKFTFEDKSKNEKTIIVYGSMEQEHHFNIKQIYQNIKTKLPSWEIYYKPHPSEIDKFDQDLIHEGFNLIEGRTQFIDILEKSTHNVGLFSSVMYYPLLMDKNVVLLDHATVGIDKELDFYIFGEEHAQTLYDGKTNTDLGKGSKFDFWKGVLHPFVFLENFQDFKDFISEEYIEEVKKRNQEFEKDLKQNLVIYDEDCTFINKSSNNDKVLKYFDDYNDNKASIRIIDYIENE